MLHCATEDSRLGVCEVDKVPGTSRNLPVLRGHLAVQYPADRLGHKLQCGGERLLNADDDVKLDGRMSNSVKGLIARYCIIHHCLKFGQ